MSNVLSLLLILYDLAVLYRARSNGRKEATFLQSEFLATG
jgi:hypothetical protein